MEIGQICFNFINCLIEMLIAMFFFSGLAKRRVSGKIAAATLSAVSIAFTVWTTFCGDFYAVTLWISIALTAFLSLCYSFRIYMALYLSFLISAISSASATLIATGFEIVGISAEAVAEKWYYYVLGIFLSRMLIILIAFLIHKNVHKFTYKAENPSLRMILILLISMVVVAAINTFMILIEITDKRLQYFLIGITIFVSVFNVMVYIIFNHLNELSAARQRLEMSRSLLTSQRQYYSSVFESQQDIQRLRHDLKHVFLAVLAKIDAGEMGVARRMVQAQLAETEQAVDFRGGSGDDIISSVIYSKKLSAQKRGVELASTLEIPRGLLLDSLDLAVLTANLLDNAIESAAELPDESARRVELGIMLKQEILIVTVKNAVVRKVDIRQIEAGRKNRPGHGFGLLSVKMIVNKYGGNYSMTCQNNLFSFTAIMHNHEQTS